MLGAVTNHLWQSSLFTIAVGLLTAALHENRAHVRYWLWFNASLKFFVSFSLLVNAGGHLGWTPTASEITAQSAKTVSLAIALIARPFPVITPHNRSTKDHLDWVPLMILALWVCGFGVTALTRLRGWQRIRAAVRSSKPLAPNGDFQAGVRLHSSPGLLEPGVVGFWRPVVLVPADIEKRLSPPQLEAVLLHELCHVRRGDNLTAGIHMVVEAVFWFHPLVWWVGARLVEERERACDEHVLEALGQPLAYAEGILSVCKLYVESSLTCVPGVTASNVSKRIEDIMNNRIGAGLNFRRSAALAFVAASASAAPIFVGTMPAPLQAQVVKRAKDPSALLRTKETVLKYALFQMRDAIDRYRGKNKQYPSSLAQLVSEGYLVQIPADPFTNRADSWKVLPPNSDQNKSADASGVYDIASGSEAMALDGTKYSTW